MIMTKKINIGIVIFAISLFRWTCCTYVNILNAVPELPVNDGIIMYYADLNDDRFTDILIYSPSNQNIYVVLMNQKSAKMKFLLHAPSSSGNTLQSIVVSDFSGNSIGDIMVCMGSVSQSKCEVWISVCTDYLICDEFKKIDTLSSQPLVFDFDSNLITDLYGSAEKSGRVWISKSELENPFKTQAISHAEQMPELGSFPYMAIVDVTGDANADILEITNSNGQPSVRVIQRTMSEFDFTEPINIPMLPENVALFGMPCFGDFNNDLNIEMVLPVCTTQNCTQSFLYLLSFRTKKWSKLKLSGDPLPIQTKAQHPLNEFVQLSALSNIHCVDANLDSRPDILIANNNDIVLYTNIGQNKFVGEKIINLNNNEIIQVSYIDHKEDGQVDILVNSKVDSKNKLQIYHSKLDLNQDINYFVRISVVVPSFKSKKEMGLVYPGCSVSLSMNGLGGKDYRITGSLLPQTNYLAISLPFIVFGLGSTPNFIDSVTVTILSKDSTLSHKDISSLMPNSQLYVIIYSEKSAWQHSIIIRPDSKMSLFYVGMTLLGTFLLCTLIVGALQLNEYIQDKKEKEIESRKFNYEAM